MELEKKLHVRPLFKLDTVPNQWSQRIEELLSFRIGNIGQLYMQDIENILTAIKEVLEEMGKSSSKTNKSLSTPHSKDSKMTEVQFS